MNNDIELTQSDRRELAMAVPFGSANRSTSPDATALSALQRLRNQD